ncbi:hypothetical protein KUV95_17110 [Microbulbifer agarilyticus]|uniref:hypothetical protein n=1 Tax=Microbulbifer agarilyticus TaxID=260552 RepID=UPI001C93869A|nr:hypothetical protein [Microbulbifer agarilyticus]MBY6213270.1 hypothetical protein [Microbulbifer agarilyticus]
MENEKNWKLKLRYGKETTPHKHFTAIGFGVAGELSEGFKCQKGPAIMAIKTWATDADESADMLRVIGGQIGFNATGKIEIYETDPEEPPKDNPFGYGINFTPYEE